MATSTTPTNTAPINSPAQKAPSAASRPKRYLVINDDQMIATVNLRNPKTGAMDEMFVQAGARAEIPKDFVFDRSTNAKYPRVRAVEIA